MVEERSLLEGICNEFSDQIRTFHPGKLYAMGYVGIPFANTKRPHKLVRHLNGVANLGFNYGIKLLTTSAPLSYIADDPNYLVPGMVVTMIGLSTGSAAALTDATVFPTEDMQKTERELKQICEENGLDYDKITQGKK